MARAPTQSDTSAPSSLASAEALIFFCLLFFYQEKKRRYSPTCVCFRKGTNTGIRIKSFDPRGSSVGRMQYAPTGMDGAWSSFLLFFYQEKKRRNPPACVCSRKGINTGIRIQSFDPRGSSVGRMLLRPTNGAAPLDPILHVCPLSGPFVGRMQYAPT